MFFCRPRLVLLRVWIACMAVCLGLTPSGVLAVDKMEAASSMASRAARAYEAGEYIRASDLYEDAWRLDPASTPLLYSAARAAQLAGNLERAETLYLRFLDLPERDADYATKAIAHQAEIPARRAEDKAAEAKRARQSGQPKLAARLYHAALRLVPTQTRWLLEAARAAHLAGDHDTARQDYQTWLDRAPAEAPERPEVQAALRDLTPRAAVPAQAPVPVVAAVAPRMRSRWPAWATVAAGGIAATTGLGLYLYANAQENQLHQDLARTDPATGYIIGATRNDAHQRAAGIEGRYAAAAVVGSAGVAAVLAGIVWLGQTPVSVGPGGVAVTAWF